jgi:hypothetical protein
MAEIPASLIRNLSFPFDTIGKSLEAVGQREELVSAARLVRVLVGYPPERFGEPPEIRDLRLRRILVHRTTTLR